MIDEKVTESKASTPYDLWPSEQTPFPPAEEPVESVVSEPFGENEEFAAPFEAPFIPVAYTPESVDETVRRSGLAWSMGVVFFGSVAFMLFLGWLADLLLGSSPWGIVAGIMLGAVIGFIQFFRISSRIFGSDKTPPEHRPLLTRHDDDE